MNSLEILPDEKITEDRDVHSRTQIAFRQLVNRCGMKQELIDIRKALDFNDFQIFELILKRDYQEFLSRYYDPNPLFSIYIQFANHINNNDELRKLIIESVRDLHNEIIIKGE